MGNSQDPPRVWDNFQIKFENEDEILKIELNFNFLKKNYGTSVDLVIIV